MKPTPLQARLLRLLVEVPGHVTTHRGKASVERQYVKLPHWDQPGYEEARRQDKEEHENWYRAVARADLKMLRRATIEACVRAGWLAEGQHGPYEWNRGWFITDAGLEIVAMLGPEDFVDRPRSVAPPTLAADVMFDALRDRWNHDAGWVWFQEFSPGVNGRRVDALAINRWGGKRGHERMGFEIKRSRGDFLGELRDPAKRHESASVADRFWFVTPAGMVQPEEVPGDCGLVWVDEEGRVTIKRKAMKRPPAPTGRALIGAILTYMVDRPGQQEWRRAMKEMGL